MTQEEIDQCLRFADFLLHQRISKRDLKKLFGCSESYAGAFVNGTKPLSKNVINQIIRTFPDLNIDWVLTGDGDMFVNEAAETDVPLIVFKWMQQVEARLLRLEAAK